MSRAIWWKSNFTWWRFSPGSARDFTRIKVLDSSKLFKKHPLWFNFTKLTLSVNILALKSEKEFSKWLSFLGFWNAEEGDVLNLPVISYFEDQDPISQLYNDADFRDVTSKQLKLKERAILAVTNGISLALNNQILSVLCQEMKLYMQQ